MCISTYVKTEYESKSTVTERYAIARGPDRDKKLTFKGPRRISEIIYCSLFLL